MQPPRVLELEKQFFRCCCVIAESTVFKPCYERSLLSNMLIAEGDVVLSLL